MNNKDIPVLLITGYLGSGKTTLLNYVLSNEQGLKFAVIVNDIGEINIDAELIQRDGVVDQSDNSLIALQNGCICCTLQKDLVEQVHKIMKMEQFDYIVIEASGVCDPAPIAQTLCTIPMLGYTYNQYGHLRLDSIVTIVDALRMQEEFDGGGDLTLDDLGKEDIVNLLIHQIEFCNLILLNKASEVTPEQLARIQRILQVLQPKADIIPCDYAKVDLDQLVNTRHFSFNEVMASAGWMQNMKKSDIDHSAAHEEHHHHEDGCHCHHHHKEGEAEEYGIGTMVYYRRRPFNVEKFDQLVAQCWPKNIIRAKGICYFSNDRSMTYVFEQAGSQKQLSVLGPWYAALSEEDIALEMQRNKDFAAHWDEKYGDRMEKIVFIGQHLDKEKLESLLDSCLEED